MMDRVSSKTPRPLRVLTAEASSRVRAGLRQQVTELAAVTIVGEAASGAELQWLLRTTHADLVLIDLGLPCPDVLAAIADCKIVHPGARVIALSQFGSAAVKLRCLAAGADAVVSKTAGPELLGEIVSDFERSPPLEDDPAAALP